jgi:mono/diheme cytochrome c family protein
VTSAVRYVVATALALGWAAAVQLAPAVRAQSEGAAGLPRIWTGVFSAAQAQRGKATFETSCSGCHGADLAGGRGPALGGVPFRTKWNNESVARLVRLIMETMPRGDPGSLSETAALEIVAYVLAENAFPAGASDLVMSRLEDDVTIVPKVPVANAGVANFTHVQAVGCLAAGPDETWRLERTGELSPAKEETVSAAELTAAKAAPSGELTVRLVSAMRFKARLQPGQRVYVKGIVNRTPRGTLLNLTALDSTGGTCTP